MQGGQAELGFQLVNINDVKLQMHMSQISALFILETAWLGIFHNKVIACKMTRSRKRGC